MAGPAVSVSDDADEQAKGRIGTVLNDKWGLERLLGVGGMGAVYLGKHRNGARAAVKVLHRFLSRHPEVKARFLREGYAANRVEHAGVVKVLDDDTVSSGADEGTAYLVMELLAGESLETRIRSGWRATEGEVLELLDRVLEVLEAAHAAGVVHRDIKPDNIFLVEGATGTGSVKVLDFGLARILEGRSTTIAGMAIGTPAYMSPEQASGKNDEIDGRTDIFAISASVFRIVAGRKVHDATQPVELTVKMATMPAPPLKSIAPHVSHALARVIDKGLAFTKEDRYATATAMRADVAAARAALEGPPERSVTELSVSDFEPSQPAAQPAPAPAPEPPPAPEPDQAPPAEVPLRVRTPALATVIGRPALDVLGAPISSKPPPPPVAEAAPAEAPPAPEPPPTPEPVAALAPEPAAPVSPKPEPPPGPITATSSAANEGSLAPVPMEKSRAVPILAAAAALLVAGGVGYALFGGSDEAGAPDTSTTTAEPAPSASALEATAEDAEPASPATPPSASVSAFPARMPPRFVHPIARPRPPKRPKH